MDAIDKTMGSEQLSVHPPKQLSFWEEAAADAPTPSRVPAVPETTPSGSSDSHQLIEYQTRIVKTVFFTLLAMVLGAIHYLDG